MAIKHWFGWMNRKGQRRATVRPSVRRSRLRVGSLEDRFLLSAPSVLGTLPIGTGQIRVAVNPTTDQVYLSRVQSNTAADVAVVDASNPAQPSLLGSVGGGFYGVTVNPSTNRFYTTDGYSGHILVYDGTSNTLLTSVAKGYCHAFMDIDPTTNEVYFESQCGGGNDPVHVLNGASNALIAGPLGSGGVASNLRVNPATGKVYATAYNSTSTWTRVFGPGPNFSDLTDLPNIAIRAVNPVTNQLFFDAGSDLQVRDGNTEALLATIPGAAGPESGVVVDTSDNRIYVCDPNTQMVKVIDGQTDTVITTFSLGTNVTPSTLTVDSVQHRLYISGQQADGTSTLYVLQDSAGQATHLQITGAAHATAGVPYSITVTALDADNHIASGYTGTVHFSSSDLKAGLPANYTFTASNAGSATFSAILKTAGTRSITVRDTVTGSIIGTLSGIQVDAAAASTLKITAPTTSTAGTSFSVMVKALDPYGNTANSYTGTVHFTSNDKKAALPANYTFKVSDGGIHIFSNAIVLVTAGGKTVTATDTTTAAITGHSSGIKIVAAALNHFKVAAPTSGIAGQAFTATVTAQDAFNNTILNYAGTIHWSSSDSQAALPADYSFSTAEKGIHKFNLLVTLKTAGSQSITVTDRTTASAGTAALSVRPGRTAGFIITAPTQVSRGVAFTITIMAVDAYHNVTTGYTGNVHFTSSDSAASLPIDYRFTTSDAGVVTFSTVLWTLGTQSLTVADSAAPSITGTDATIQVS